MATRQPRGLSPQYLMLFKQSLALARTRKARQARQKAARRPPR